MLRSHPATPPDIRCLRDAFRFDKAVTFDGNIANSGAAFAIDGGSITFKKPQSVTSRNAVTYDTQFSVSPISNSVQTC